MSIFDSKIFLRSKTIWGLLIAILPQAEELISAAQEVAPILPPQLGSIITTAGIVIAAIGRFNKNIKPITLK